MYNKQRKAFGAFAALAVAVSLFQLPAAQAASTSSQRWDSKNTTGVGFAIENKAAEADINNFVKYYTPTVKLWDVIAPPGGTIKFQYLVKDASGNPLANTAVTIIYNPAYTNGTAISTTGTGAAIPVIHGDSKDGLLVPATTDASGIVTFSVINTDASGDPAIANDGVVLPPASATKYTQVQVYVGSFTSTSARSSVQTTQDIDILEIHYMTGVTVGMPFVGVVATPTPTPTPTPVATPTPTPVATPTPTPTPTATTAAGVNVRLVSPVLTDANSIHRADLEKTFSVDNTWYPVGVGFRQTYLPTGSKFAVAYKVTDATGAALAGKTVKLHVNKSYSKSNAKITDGKNATDSTKDDSQGNDQLVLTATTDAKGVATFNLQNTDTKGEAVPATPITPTPVDASKGALFSQIYPEVNGATDIADFLEIHFTTAPAAKVTITCVKGKVSTKITALKPVCPKGYTLKK